MLHSHRKKLENVILNLTRGGVECCSLMKLLDLAELHLRIEEEEYKYVSEKLEKMFDVKVTNHDIRPCFTISWSHLLEENEK
jgi:hypothetical protein